MKDVTRISRRAMLSGGTLILGATGLGSPRLFASDRDDLVRCGLVTDLHYADKATSGSRHYRQTLGKLEVAAEQFSSKPPDFLVELGDLIDAADSVQTELGYLKRINQDFSAICPNRHYVLGNHCVHTLTKEEFLGGVGQSRSFYSFDVGPIHFVVLDACFRNDGTPYGRKNFVWTDANVSPQQIDWLREDLQASSRKTVILAHQRLDVSNNHGIRNAPAVRQVLEDSGNVLAVFQGHSHKNDHREIAGIHYCTFVAMVEGDGPENNGFSTVSIAGDGEIQVQGFLKQQSYRWQA